MSTENRIKSTEATKVFKNLDFLDIGASGSNIYRSLTDIDLSEWKGKNISKAVLSLYWYYPSGKTRTNDTVIEVYRPAAYNPEYASWKNKDNEIAWTNAGGDWFDSKGVAQGNSPYATLTISGSKTPDNAYHELDTVS